MSDAGDAGEITFTAAEMQDPDMWDDKELIAAYEEAVRGALRSSGAMSGPGFRKPRRVQLQQRGRRRRRGRGSGSDEVEGEEAAAAPATPGGPASPSAASRPQQPLVDATAQMAWAVQQQLQQSTVPTHPVSTPLPSRGALPQPPAQPPGGRAALGSLLPPELAADAQLVSALQGWYSAGFQSGFAMRRAQTAQG
eukprot:TRINITY_DN25342_c0_g1_i1.p3 TRINITY_DN25342_c0_g1~~TRINITY_DN25342_c0_g1_i1.p3  ORF type:complete len:223 (+),score=80.21 TRINITY_DN25342_c0_g1_i1:85-669(+)